jgi:AcrR family transcriptional regulator
VPRFRTRPYPEPLLSLDKPSGDAPTRERLYAALFDLLADHDFGVPALETLIGRAGLAPEDFYRHFDSFEECFTAIWSETDSELKAAFLAGFEGEREWQDRLRAAILAALRFFAQNPDRALLYFKAAEFSDDLRTRQLDAITCLGQVIDLGRRDSGRAEQPPIAFSEAASGAIWRQIGAMVWSGKASQLPDRLYELMYYAILPHRGLEAAETELRNG